ncbi:hypothetical protein ACIGO6_33260 [Streptomyces sp. NPDC053750]|uniref:hypothetical protein n=1 Tax=Streptomyces sp. NPDC053750 TaxID=3365714 RepID=UPI0037D1E78C
MTRTGKRQVLYRQGTGGVADDGEVGLVFAVAAGGGRRAAGGGRRAAGGGRAIVRARAASGSLPEPRPIQARSSGDGSWPDALGLFS